MTTRQPTALLVQSDIGSVAIMKVGEDWNVFSFADEPYAGCHATCADDAERAYAACELRAMIREQRAAGIDVDVLTAEAGR